MVGVFGCGQKCSANDSPKQISAHLQGFLCRTQIGSSLWTVGVTESNQQVAESLKLEAEALIISEQ